MRKKRCTNARIWNKILMGLMLVVMLSVADSVVVEAETIDFKARMVELQKKFPNEKYWNKVGKLTDNSDGYTDQPCGLHSVKDIHISGTGGCTCNHFAGGGHVSATQCMGFANKLGFEVFGDTTWTQISNPTTIQIADIRIGDIVRFDYNSHSVFVISKTGNQIMVGEANYPNGCQIKWGRIINLSTANITYYERAANYDAVIGSQNAEVGTLTPSTETTTETTETPGGTTSTEQGTTEDLSGESTTESNTEATTEAGTDYTGWEKTADGKHYQYYKSGKLQKKKWLTIKKKKYYVDEDGYRVTGFYDIDCQTYYFNNKGEMQKNKWFTLDGENYYVNTDGVVLKLQWLYYKNKLVYVTEDGSIAKSEIVKIGSKQYYFNSKGHRSKGFKKYKGKYYYSNSSGVIQKKKWITQGKNKYYLQKSGVRVQSKLTKIGKYQYYFDSKGRMVKNKKVTYKGKIYKADKKGRCKFVSKEPVTEESTETTESATEQPSV